MRFLTNKPWRNLDTRLALFYALALSVSVLSFAWYHTRQHAENELASIHEQVRFIAREVATYSAGYLVTSNLGELEQRLLTTIQHPNLGQITIIQASGRNAIRVARAPDGSYRVTFGESDDEQLPAGNTVIMLPDDKMRAWQVIAPDSGLGWVQVDYNLNNYYQQQHVFLARSLLLALATVLAGLVLLRFVTRKPLNNLRRASEFAAQLHNHLGDTLVLDDSTTETRQLLDALNNASSDLYNQHRLLEAIRELQSQFIADVDARTLFNNLLVRLLTLTGSEYGFIAEVLYRDGQPYLKSHAISNIAWNEETRNLYEANVATGLEFYKLNSLFGHILTSREAVIANDPGHDPRRGGLPPGHPPLNAFLGLPLLSGDALVGAIGLANRHGGYDQELVQFLEPILSTCAHLISAYRANARLNETSALQQAILDNASDGIITIDATGHIRSFNLAAEKIFGYQASEVLGKNIRLLMPEPYHSQHDGYLEHYLATGERKIIGSGREVTGRRKDGSVFPLDLAVNEININNERLFTGLLRDISQRKHDEQVLRQTLSLQRAILNSADYSIISTTPDGLITTFNNGAQRLLGYRPDEMVLKTTPAIIHDLDEVAQRASELSHELGRKIEPGFEVFVAMARQGTAEEREWTYIRKDGSRVPVLLSVTAMQDEQGNITGFLGIASDITMRKRAERMKDEFVSTVSHELRTPLTSIRGSLGLVRGGITGELPPQAQGLIDIAYNNSERLLAIINDILDISKIESGKMEYHMVSLPIMQLVDEALHANEDYARQYHVAIIISSREDDARIWADSARLMQVMNNLLSNAAKFSEPGTNVEISVTLVRDGVRVAVRDHGPGIPADFRNRVFEKFSQADASDTRQKGGTGLGLSIARAIVLRHGGKIGFDSTPGQGSEFWFVLPEDIGPLR